MPRLTARGALVLAAATSTGVAALSACVSRGPPLDRWARALEAVGVSAAGLARGPVALSPDAEPGVLPDGGLALPSAWVERDLTAAELARLAHLARHRERGLPDLAALGCPAWRLVMLAEELDGLAIEARVLARGGVRVPASTWSRALAERDEAYARRCR